MQCTDVLQKRLYPRLCVPYLHLPHSGPRHLRKRQSNSLVMMLF